jgi:hypothetical protein
MTVTQYMLAHPGHILAGAGASFVAFLLVVRILTEIRVRRCGGVRAPIIASNPFTCACPPDGTRVMADMQQPCPFSSASPAHS